MPTPVARRNSQVENMPELILKSHDSAQHLIADKGRHLGRMGSFDGCKSPTSTTNGS